MEDDEEAENLSIPLAPLARMFDCPVCYEKITECMMTPCGHNFCAACVDECLNRKHQCPCCNTPCVVGDLRKNRHFDEVASVIQREGDAASKSYFEALFKSSGERPAAGGAPAPASNKQFSPIETLFHTHMKRSLAQYEEFYRELLEKKMLAVSLVQTRYAERMAKEGGDLAALREQCATESAAIGHTFEQSIQLLLEQYAAFLENVAVEPVFLPVSVQLRIEGKDVVVAGVTLDPTETVAQAEARLREGLEAQGDAIVEMGAQTVWKLERAYAGPMVAQNQLLDARTPLAKYKMEPGSTLWLCGGGVVLKSEAPAVCFSLEYEEGAGLHVDYYTCVKCRVNWVCAACSVACHAGHELKPHTLDHVPTWACCYCFKKKGRCKLPNVRSKKKK